MSQRKSYPSATVLGIPISRLDRTQTLAAICSMIDRYKKEKRAHYLATAHLDFLTNALSWFSHRPRDQELLDCLRQAQLITADGMPILWYLKALGLDSVERITGADLFPQVAQIASEKGYSVFLLGGTEEVSEQVAHMFEKENPSLKVVGRASPIISFEEDHEQLLETINQAAPDILFVGLGNPKQEIWFQRNKDKLAVPVSIGVGGSFNFYAGKVSRAPSHLQNSGFEWLYRLYQEPKRLWKRYLVNLVKGIVIATPSLVYHCWKKTTLRKVHSQGNKIHIEKNEDEVVVIFPAYLAHDQAKTLSSLLSDIEEDSITLDLRQTQYLEVSCLSSIVDFMMHHKNVAVLENKKIKKLFKVHRVWDLVK